MEKKEIIDTSVGLKDGQYFCPNCGATEIHFNEKLGKLHCEYCDSTFDGEKLSDLLKNSNNLSGKTIGSGAKDIKDDFNDLITIRCNGCGAEIVIDTKNSTEMRCHWCRGILSINSRIENGTVPDAILPFSVKRDEAKKEIEKFIKSRKFYASKKFKKEFTTDNVLGVYFPYMIVDANAKCNFVGEGEHQTRKYIINDSTYYEADLYKVRRAFDISIDDLTIESNKDRLDKVNDAKTNNIINSVMPFDTENCIKFTSNYLTGYTSEKRNINVGEIESVVNKQIQDIARYAINNDLKFYDRGVKWHIEYIDVEGTQWITAYLPIWLYSYHENNNGKERIHYVAVNARTKETMGSVPLNKKRLFMVSAIVETFSGITALIILSNIDTDDKGSLYILLLFLAGFVYYAIIYSKYRNKEARNTYEKETRNNITNLVKEDTFIEKRKKLRSSHMSGANNKKINGDTVFTSTNIVDSIAEQYINNDKKK